MAGWYIRRGEQVIGPAGLAKLKELVADGRLLPTDQLAKDPGGPWTEAGQTTLFAPPPGTNVMPPAPRQRSLAPKTKDQPPATKPVQTVMSVPPPVDTEVSSQGEAAPWLGKSLVVALGRGLKTTGGAVAKTTSMWLQRRHELKLAKIKAKGDVAAIRAANQQQAPTLQQPVAGVPAGQSTIINIVNKNTQSSGCAGCLLVTLLLFLAWLFFGHLLTSR